MKKSPTYITLISQLSTHIYLVLYTRGYSIPVAHITHHIPSRHTDANVRCETLT